MGLSCREKMAPSEGFEPVIYGATSRRELLASPNAPLKYLVQMDHLLNVGQSAD